jgi:hypothetical protein
MYKQAIMVLKKLAGGVNKGVFKIWTFLCLTTVFFLVSKGRQPTGILHGKSLQITTTAKGR